MNFEVRSYTDANGRTYINEWLNSIYDPTTKRRILARLKRLKSGNLGDNRSLGEGLAELRLDFGPGYRIYYGRVGNQIILLLCGGDKSSQQRDIEKAHRLWNQVLKIEERLKRFPLFDEYHAEYLRDPENARGYLDVCLEDYVDDQDGKFLAQTIEQVWPVLKLKTAPDEPLHAFLALAEKLEDGRPLPLEEISRILSHMGLKLSLHSEENPADRATA